MFQRVSVAASVILVATLTAAGAQPRTPQDNLPELLARGWSALAAGQLPEAAGAAVEAMAVDPRSAAAVALAVEVEIARSGGTGGLRTYEQWLGARPVEAPYVLRRVARATLWDIVEQTRGSATATEALAALAADGDPAANARLGELAGTGSLPELIVSASAGNEAGVEALIRRMETIPAARVNLIKALGESGSARALPAVTAYLTDRRDEHRAAAAEAVGRLGGSPDLLRPLLQDPNFTVRLKAAGALYRLEDPAGLSLLQQIAQSEHAGVRVGAAEEMASHPDAAWLTIVRSLAQDADPAVRLQAARLIAPHEPETAREVLDHLARDANPGIREEAARINLRQTTTDLTELRRRLRSPAGEQVAAAARILELTR